MKVLPIFSLLKSDLAIKALLETNGILRVFDYGIAPEGVALPYVVFQQISGTPYNTYTCSDVAERVLVQFDVYAKTAQLAFTITSKIKEGLSHHCYFTDFRGIVKDTDGLYRSSFDCSWHLL